MEEQSLLYLDTNRFRKITRKRGCLEKFESFFEKEDPGVLDLPILFTWSQLLESIDLGDKILTEITESQIWKTDTKKKNILKNCAPHEGLDYLFRLAVDAIKALPALQKEALLARIDKALSYVCKEAQLLMDDTLLRCRALVLSDKYMEDLSFELAWAFISSYSFVGSEKQWEQRKNHYESLIALWHKFYLEGHEFVFFRLCEQQFYAYLQYSPEFVLEEALFFFPQAKTRDDIVNEIFKYRRLKAGSDLCDGEIIDFCCLGTQQNAGAPKSTVIGVTMDDKSKIEQRIGVFSRSLLDLAKVDGWSAKPCPGKIFCLKESEDGTLSEQCPIPPESEISKN